MWTVEAIGSTAGQVWEFLSQHGKCSLNGVQRAVRAPKSLVDMAIGWLAREGKVELTQEKRSIQVWIKNI